MKFTPIVNFGLTCLLNGLLAGKLRAGAKKGGDIKNLDIVQQAYPLYKQSQAQLIWVRGHAGIESNELADQWANKARLGARVDA